MTDRFRTGIVTSPALPALVSACLVWSLSLAACAVDDDGGALSVPPPVLVRIHTDLGAIDVEIDQARAPVTAANFLRYVDGGHYDGGRFHRTVHLDNQPDNEILIEVIQGGVSGERVKDDFEPIALERTSRTGLRHTDGTISMARDGPDTATSDFFICIGDQPELDYGGRRNPDGQGFAAFGRVVGGMDVVRTIQRAPARGQSLDPPVAIISAGRVKSDRGLADGHD